MGGKAHPYLDPCGWDVSGSPGTDPRGRLSQEEFKEDWSPAGETGNDGVRKEHRHLGIQPQCSGGKLQSQRGQDLHRLTQAEAAPERLAPINPLPESSWSPPCAPLAPGELTLHVAHVPVGAPSAQLKRGEEHCFLAPAGSAVPVAAAGASALRSFLCPSGACQGLPWSGCCGQDHVVCVLNASL